jgi:hypothetical protein
MKNSPIYLLPLMSKCDKVMKFNQEPCILCERPVNINENTKYVHMLTTLEAVTEEEHKNSQGLFPIGNECCKKLPKEYIFKFK